MSIVQDLQIAARRWLKVRGGPSALAGGEAEREEVRRWFREWSGKARPDVVVGAELIEMEATQMPWLDTGIDLEAGQWVTTLAAGRVVISEALDVWVGPQFELWMRVGETGTIFNGTRSTNSFLATEAGRLYLGNSFPGQWGDSTGRVSTALADYQKSGGGMTVVVLRWAGGAAAGLSELESEGRTTGQLAEEQTRLHTSLPPPKGWEPLWFIGQNEIFRDETEDGHPCIACCTEKNVGILQHDAVFDLTEQTRLRWKWRVDELPSALPENSAVSHDYLSVAVEFENGRDITYTWSPELAEGTGYWCPLPTWKDREFHVVIRSGTQGLGTWLEEERNVYADYAHYIGQPPSRIVRIWLIAVSVFQRGRGAVLYRDFSLEDGSSGRRLRVG